ncbi:hypothetical protein HDV00_010890 [Rhizophlyctis rosea]|nr:hypothetical protein HDV00_010890 [Rhizophlyctis rosea]
MSTLSALGWPEVAEPWLHPCRILDTPNFGWPSRITSPSCLALRDYQFIYPVSRPFSFEPATPKATASLVEGTAKPVEGHLRIELEDKNVQCQEYQCKLEEQEYQHKFEKEEYQRKLEEKAKEVEELKLERARLIEKNHVKDGKLHAYKEMMEEYRKTSEHARESRQRAEKKSEVVEQQFLARALLDDFITALRATHNTTTKSYTTKSLNTAGDNRNKDEATRRHLFQYCDCASCVSTFEQIHTNIIQSFHLVNAFTVSQMRLTLMQCWDRFCKVAHPMEKTPIKIDAFHDEWVKHVLWGVAAKAANVQP